jgi:hypothetical protein
MGDPEGGDLLVLGWGGTRRGRSTKPSAARRANGQLGLDAHLRYLNPFPQEHWATC